MTTLLLLTACLTVRGEDVQQTIRDRYLETLAAMRTVRTEAELESLIDSMDAPEWTGTMPAGEPLTRNSVLAEGRAALAIAPDKLEKFFPDRVLVDGVSPVFAPHR